MTRTLSSRCLSYGLLLGLALFLSGGVQSREPDMDVGEEINELCAGCHGEFGQGGKEGEYPRLAGQPAGFLVQQLHLFRDRKRPNLAMVEYVDERQMPDEDIQDISAYLAAIKLPTRMQAMAEDDPSFNALARLEAAKRVLQIPPAEGDVDNGGRLYRRECASCHGRDGMGDVEDAVPMIAGQYTRYLWRQVDKYLDGVRIHDPSAPDDRLLAEFSKKELQDIFAYVSRLDD